MTGANEEAQIRQLIEGWVMSPYGTEMGMRGVYREVVPPERLVHTEVFDQPGYPGESVITTVLAERGGKTTFTATLRYESREARDGVLLASTR